MTPRRILVTGASGFVGRHLANALCVAFPDAILALDRFDICDPHAVADRVAGVCPDACIHLAAMSSTAAARADPARAWAVNLQGTLHLAEAILRTEPDCMLVYASSGEIYGGPAAHGRKLDELTLAAPRTIYAATKAAADLTIGALASDGLRSIRLRPFNHTGPGQSASFAVPAFARQIARIELGLQPPILAAGDLDATRDFLDVRDVCAAYVAAIVNMDTLPVTSVFSIASGTSRRIGSVLDDLLSLAGVPVAIEGRPGVSRHSDDEVSAGCADAAKVTLGWWPRIPWDDTLRDVLEYWRRRVGSGRQGGNDKDHCESSLT